MFLALRQDFLHHIAMHVGQPHVAAAEAEGQALVVDAEQVQHRGVQVVNLDLVLDGFVAVIVGGAVDRAAFDAAAGQPDGEAKRVVIAAVGPLGEGRAAELAGPDDQRRLQQPAAFRSFNSAAIGWSTARALFSWPVSQAAVLVPAIAADAWDRSVR